MYELPHFVMKFGIYSTFFYCLVGNMMINHKISLYVFLAKYFNQQLSSFGFYWFGGCKYRGLSSSSSLKEETEDSQNLVRACGGRNISELHLKQRCFLHYVMQSWNLFDFNCCHFYFHLLWNQFREIDFSFVIVVIYFQWKSNSPKILWNWFHGKSLRFHT